MWDTQAVLQWKQSRTLQLLLEVSLFLKVQVAEIFSAQRDNILGGMPGSVQNLDGE